VVFGWKEVEYKSWIMDSRPSAGDDTHRARLVCIEELKPKVCEHEVQVINYTHGHPIFPLTATCARCGIKLTATWKAEE
jgi:hypothetical protein